MTECESYRNCLEIEGNVKMPLDLASGDLHLPRQALGGNGARGSHGGCRNVGILEVFSKLSDSGILCAWRFRGLVCDLLVEEEEEEG